MFMCHDTLGMLDKEITTISTAWCNAMNAASCASRFHRDHCKDHRFPMDNEYKLKRNIAKLLIDSVRERKHAMLLKLFDLTGSLRDDGLADELQCLHGFIARLEALPSQFDWWQTTLLPALKHDADEEPEVQGHPVIKRPAPDLTDEEDEEDLQPVEITSTK